MHKTIDRKIFEMMLGEYCSPALAGIKPANMICIRKEKLPLFSSIHKEYNDKMNKYDIYFYIIKETSASYLIMVYRKCKLLSHLMGVQVSAMLKREGYPDLMKIDSYLAFLSNRFNSNYCPPDEIGLFLGYPVEDVIGFKKNRGRNCIISKYWKVYTNENEAQKMFLRYEKCKNSLCDRLHKGASITEMFTKVVA